MSSHGWPEEGWDSLEPFLMMVPISSQGHTHDHTHLSPPLALPSDKVESAFSIGTGSWILSMRWFYHVGSLKKSICGKQEQAGPAGQSRVVLSLLGIWSLLGPCPFFVPLEVLHGPQRWLAGGGLLHTLGLAGAGSGMVVVSAPVCPPFLSCFFFLCGSFESIHLNSHPLRNLIIKATLNLSVPISVYTEKGSACVQESERSSNGMSG